MKKIKYFLLAVLMMCSVIGRSQTNREKSIREIIAAETDFAKMAASKGIMEAFAFYAADDVVIKRGNDSLITGKEGVRNFYSKDVFKNAVLNWAPDFADASESGDLGYTVGKYTWQLKDEAGNIIDDKKGVFHTVWKKQADGKWKFVWD